MKKSVISKLLAELERLVQVEQESGVVFWLARDLQTVLGYAKWDNFRKVVGDAATACETSGNKASDHFIEVSKLIEHGKGGRREIQDFMLTRYACYHQRTRQEQHRRSQSSGPAEHPFRKPSSCRRSQKD